MTQSERDKALRLLASKGRPRERLDAAEVLCDLAAEASAEEKASFVPVLSMLCADEQPEVRCAGLSMTESVLSPAEALEVLGRFVADAHDRVRVEAIGRLADLQLPESRNTFAHALTDTSRYVRFEAARGMAGLKHSAGLAELSAALDDNELRFRAASALAALGDSQAIPALEKAFRGWFLPPFDRTQIAGALATLGAAEGTTYLLKRMRASRWTVDRAMAIQLLGELRVREATEDLTRIAQDVKEPCRGAAARALGSLNAPGAEALLTELLSLPDQPEDFRLDLAEGLWRLNTPSSRERVRQLTFADADDQGEWRAMMRDIP